MRPIINCRFWILLIYYYIGLKCLPCTGQHQWTYHVKDYTSTTEQPSTANAILSINSYSQSFGDNKLTVSTNPTTSLPTTSVLATPVTHPKLAYEDTPPIEPLSSKHLNIHITDGNWKPVDINRRKYGDGTVNTVKDKWLTKQNYKNKRKRKKKRFDRKEKHSHSDVSNGPLTRSKEWRIDIESDRSIYKRTLKNLKDDSGNGGGVENKFENDNTLEGGGDKEFFTENIPDWVIKPTKRAVRLRKLIHSIDDEDGDIPDDERQHRSRHRRSSSQNETVGSDRTIQPNEIKFNDNISFNHSFNHNISNNISMLPIVISDVIKSTDYPIDLPSLTNLTLNSIPYELPLLDDEMIPPPNRNEQNEQIIIISNGDRNLMNSVEAKLRLTEHFSPADSSTVTVNGDDMDVDLYLSDEPKALPLRPIIRGPYDDDDEHGGEVSIVYAEQHTEVKLNCEVDLDISTTVWMKDGQMVHTSDRNTRPTDYRFVRETRGGLTITNVMLEDDGKWQCEAENARGYVENARPVKLVVLDRPKPPYLLIDSRRLDAGNIFVPVKENSELSLACVSEGGNPRPTLSWEVLLSPGVDRHAQKVAADVLELQEVVKGVEKNREAYKINSGAKSEAKLPAVYRAHHNARILCVMEHPTLKMRQNASLLLDVQYTPSFAISRTPGFGYPLREGIEVSLKCDVDSNPPSTPLWQSDDADTPVQQTGDGFLNFTSLRREHSGWYKCTSKHLNFQYSSIGYYLSIRYDSVDVTSEPLDPEITASNNPNKVPQLEVQLGGAVTLQCPQGSLGCWSHLDPTNARLRGLGIGLTTPTGQFSLKDVVYQDAGTYKCIGQSPQNKKKVEILHTVAVQVKGAPSVTARNTTPVAYPGSPLHLSVEFCANPPAFAARWLHGDRIYTPGNQYGIDVLAYGVIDLPIPFCKEARLTYVHMHERVSRTFHFVVSSPGGVAEAIFHVNFTLRHKVMTNNVDDDEGELGEPEEIQFPVFGSSGRRSGGGSFCTLNTSYGYSSIINICFIKIFLIVSLLVMILNQLELRV